MFRTRDMSLASHLHSNQVVLDRVEADGSNRAIFYFEDPPQELIDVWLAGEAEGGTKETIRAYKHLVQQARIAVQNYNFRSDHNEQNTQANQ